AAFLVLLAGSAGARLISPYLWGRGSRSPKICKQIGLLPDVMKKEDRIGNQVGGHLFEFIIDIQRFDFIRSARGELVQATEAEQRGVHILIVSREVLHPQPAPQLPRPPEAVDPDFPHSAFVKIGVEDRPPL